MVCRQRLAVIGLASKKPRMKRFLYLSLSMMLAARFVDGAGLRVLSPKPYTLVQRHSATGGPIRVRGTFAADAPPERIEARLAGGPWQALEVDGGQGRFSGRLWRPSGRDVWKFGASARRRSPPRWNAWASGIYF